MNPFELHPQPIERTLRDWNALCHAPYDKHAVDPYTKTRIILMNGTEFENVWFSHQFSRMTSDNDLRRELALIRRGDQQQQRLIACLKPADESILEHTLSYEQLTVDLTAEMARKEKNPDVRRALDFALLEDFDHVYRYANLLDMEYGLSAQELTGGYVEITPGRPTIAEHRHPFDSIRAHITPEASLLTQLHAGIITAAEQQTMNYYMNVAGFYPSEEGRRLYQEIGLIEEQHVSQYGSLIDPDRTPLECLLMHQYTECYLYYSCLQDETDASLRALWSRCFEDEVAHLHHAAHLLAQYEHTDWQEVIPDGEFPTLLSLHSNIEYVRGVLSAQADLTAHRETYVPVNNLPDGSDFARYQALVNEPVDSVPSHRVIERYMTCFGTDYRFETALNPIEALQNRHKDNTCVGRPQTERQEAHALR